MNLLGDYMIMIPQKTSKWKKSEVIGGDKYLGTSTDVQRCASKTGDRKIGAERELWK